MLCDDLEAWEGVAGRSEREGIYGYIYIYIYIYTHTHIYICIYIADSLCCKAEINTILQSNYTPIKINHRFGFRSINDTRDFFKSSNYIQFH